MTRRELLHLSIDGEVKRKVEAALEGRKLSFSRLVEILLTEWLAKETRKNAGNTVANRTSHPAD